MVTKTASSKTTKSADAVLTFADISKIDPHANNPRQSFADLESLGASLGEYGILQPVLLRPIAGGRYQLVAGGRRYRAAQKAGLKRVPALVKTISDADAHVAMLIENLERKDLNPMEKARGLARLCTPVDEGGAGLTHAAAAAKFGHSQPWATNAIRLLKLPAGWQRRIADGEICEARARELLPYIERPNVMAAIERDYGDPSSRPFYDTYRGFKRQVELIATNHNAVSKRWRAPRSDGSSGNGHSGNGAMATLGRTTSSIGGHHAQPAAGLAISPAASPANRDSASVGLNSTKLAGLICSQVMNLATEKELEIVEQAVADRRRQLAKTSAT